MFAWRLFSSGDWKCPCVFVGAPSTIAALGAAEAHGDRLLQDALDLTREVLGGSSVSSGHFIPYMDQANISKPAICICRVMKPTAELPDPGLQRRLGKLLIQKRCIQKAKRKAKDELKQKKRPREASKVRSV